MTRRDRANRTSERNIPCWCGSGKKYKKCHSGRERQPRATRSDAIDALRASESRRLCLHPAASIDTCTGDIVRAHSVQRSLVRRIARNGKVYSPTRDFGDLYRVQDEIPLRLRGLNEVTTFTGFCKRHDTELFRPIEMHDVRACQEHACLLAYRASSREYYHKHGMVSMEQFAKSLDRGRSISRQVAHQDWTSEWFTAARSGLADLAIGHDELANAISAGDYSCMDYFVLWLESPPQVMCSFATQPDWGFDARPIQNLRNVNAPAESIYGTALCSGDCGCFFFTWLRRGRAVCVELVNSLLTLSSDRIPDALIAFEFCVSDNLCIGPDWWESLDEDVKVKLRTNLKVGAGPEDDITSNYLDCSGVYAANWRVIRIETNVPDFENARSI